jgi:transcription elongation factor SPT4
MFYLLTFGLWVNLTAKYVRGIYAVRVQGHVPDDVEAELDSRGFKYRSRDQTDQD